MNNREIGKKVREICLKHGYEIWFAYSDRCTKHRRLKYMRNGATVTDKMKTGILDDITEWKNQLTDSSTILDFGWKTGTRFGYGKYDYFYVNVKLNHAYELIH